jgi:threonine dehydrogenase-like Zn-dependent dehydrogenase
MIVVEHLGPREAAVREHDDLQPGPGQARVAMRVGGICGSDLHVYRKPPWPHSKVLGHEPCGVIDAVGQGVDPARVGQRVTVYHYDACNACRWCRMGEKHWCDSPDGPGTGGGIRVPGWHVSGSCGEQVVIDAANALPLPDGLSFEAGAILACGAATSWSALSKVTPTAEDDAVVWGLGPVGLCGVMMLKAWGCHVVAVGRRDARLELAERFGADAVIDEAATDDVAAAVRDALPATAGPRRGASLAYETTGHAAAQKAMMHTLGRFGRAAVVGIGSKEPAFNLGAITGKQITLHGSHVMNFGEYDFLLDFIARHDLPLDQIVTHRVPYANGDEAFRIADRGDCGKVVLVDDA